MSITPPRRSHDYGNHFGPASTTNGPAHSEGNYYGMSNDAFEREMLDMAARGTKKQPKPDGALTKAVKKLLSKIFK